MGENSLNSLTEPAPTRGILTDLTGARLFDDAQCTVGRWRGQKQQIRILDTGNCLIGRVVRIVTHGQLPGA